MMRLVVYCSSSLLLSTSSNFLLFLISQQASKAVKLRNLGQRERNMLAKAGESDRAIKTKMVSLVSILVC